MNSALENKKNIIQFRNKLLKYIRQWFEQENFLEVETPILTKFSCPEPHLYPLDLTFHELNGNEHRGYLSLSPELSLKKLLSSGYEQIFEVARCFRDREHFASNQHNVEFSLLEWYRKEADYNKIILDCQNLLSFVTDKLLISNTINYGEQIYSLKTWRETTVAEVFNEWAGINLNALEDWEELVSIAKERGLKSCQDAGDAFSALFVQYIDKEIAHLKEGLVLKDYPSCQSGLAKSSVDERYVERFEIFFAGMELANGYSELCDSDKMTTRYLEFIRWQQKHTGQKFELDEEFIEGLDRIGRAGGVALGIDRLLMLLANQSSIEEVILFPTSSLFQ